MKTLHVMAILACVSALTACTYDSVRMHQRQRCGAMPQTEAARCYSRTQDTRAEYDTRRRKLEQSTGGSKEKLEDPRYESWIP